MEEKWRAEMKYTIPAAESRMLSARLSAFMNRDANGGENGYAVRSLYFDNFYNKVLREKLDGIGIRDKYRIRCYDNDFSFLRLEKKNKKYDRGNKSQCVVTKEEVLRILDGDTDWMALDERPLVRELFLRMRLEFFRPQNIVEYDREAFTYGPGNVRITFDRNIRGCGDPRQFFREQLPSVPALNYGLTVMEVKYDDYLPDVVNRTVLTVRKKEQAFSKYAACRLAE